MTPPPSASAPTRASALAAEIRAEMARQSMTAAALAEETEYHRMTLSYWLNAKRPIPLEALFKIAQALGVPASELTKRAEAAS